MASVAHGSGFLAVFIAGLLVGDVRRPFRHEESVFLEGLSTLSEIVVFVALGLTIGVSQVDGSRWLDGIASVAFLALVARPLVVRRGARARPPPPRGTPLRDVRAA